MPGDRDLVRLQDILHEIAGIRDVTRGIAFDSFDQSWAVLRAVQHGLLIIGEAAKNISTETKGEKTDIPWGRISALGNFLRHEYAAIDNRRLWDIVQNHLDPLDLAVRDLLAKPRGHS